MWRARRAAEHRCSDYELLYTSSLVARISRSNRLAKLWSSLITTSSLHFSFLDAF